MAFTRIGMDENNQFYYVHYQMRPSSKCKKPIIGYKYGDISYDGEGVTLTKPF